MAMGWVPVQFPAMWVAIAAAALGMGQCAAGLGGVTWQTPKVSVEVKPGEKSVTVPYVFRVSGTSRVRIEDVDTGCACSHYSLEKREFSPGEEGTLRITVDVGDREGEMNTPMLVRMKEGENEAVDTLHLSLAIPTLATFSARVVMFGEKDKSREITVTSAPELRLVLSVGDVVGPYKAELGRTEKGRQTLRVMATGEHENGYVQVVASQGKTIVKSWRVFIRVQK